MNKQFRTESTISLILKCIVVLCAGIGTYLSWAGGRYSFMGGDSVFMYFTIQSNIAIALICLFGAILLICGKAVTRVGQIVKLMGTVSITLTGFVFCFVLAPTMHADAWSAANVLTHMIVPIASVLDFFAVGYRYAYRKADDLWVLMPPLMYVIYAGIAYAKGWQFSSGTNYPYFFLNWGSEAGAFGFCEGLPFMGSGWWILVLLFFLLGVGFAYLRILDAIRKRCSTEK